MIRQKTLKNVIRATGVGLHTGEKIYLTLRPAAVDSGIIFVRVDTDPTVEIPALTEFVGNTTLATTISRAGQNISTVEHFMSAFSGLGLDNAYVAVSGPYMPPMDGCYATFVLLTLSAGIAARNAPQKFLRITKDVTLNDQILSRSSHPPATNRP